ncbi:MAG: hypothetical protein HW418_1410, partial [Anaerolineales bacterium]|nr:hypothetical protein [Anaerolineales bacterium]
MYTSDSPSGDQEIGPFIALTIA